MSGTAGAIASAASRSALTGTDFGTSLLATLPQSIGNTIGNAVAGSISSEDNTAAQGQAGGGGGSTYTQGAWGAGVTGLTDPGSIQPFQADLSSLDGLQLSSPGAAYAATTPALHGQVIVGDDGAAAETLHYAPFQNVEQTLDMNTFNIRVDGVNNWIAENDPLQIKYDYSLALAGINANRDVILQNDAAVAGDLHQLNIVAGAGLALAMGPVALMAGLDALGIGAGTSFSSTATSSLNFFGYEGSLATMGTSVGVKATIGLASEWGANALTGQNMTFAKGAGAIVGSAVFAPGVGKLTEAFRPLTSLVLQGAAAGGGGNFVEQSVDFLNEGKAFSGSALGWSIGFGALGGALGWANMQTLPTPMYLNPLANSLHDDIVKFPVAVGAMPALVLQKTIPMPHWMTW